MSLNASELLEDLENKYPLLILGRKQMSFYWMLLEVFLCLVRVASIVLSVVTGRCYQTAINHTIQYQYVYTGLRDKIFFEKILIWEIIMITLVYGVDDDYL